MTLLGEHATPDAVADHQAAIDETVRYTLVIPAPYPPSKVGKRFVVGVRSDAGQFQKLCVLDFGSDQAAGEVERNGSLQDLVLIQLVLPEAG